MCQPKSHHLTLGRHTPHSVCGRKYHTFQNPQTSVQMWSMGEWGVLTDGMNQQNCVCVCVCACFILAIFLCRDCLWTVQIFSAWRKDKINYTSNSVNWFAWVIYNSSKHSYWSGGGLQAFFFLKNSYSSLAAAPTGHWLCLGYAVMPADSPVETRCKSVTWYELTVVWMSCVNNWSISLHYFFSKS